MKRVNLKSRAGFGILMAAAGFFAPQAHATGWCPSSTDYTISCNNCTLELTCHVYNTSIVINGSNVTLDGQGNYGIWNSPGPGITVNSAPVTIKDVEVNGAGSGQSQSQPGILFTQQVSTAESFVQGVEVYSSTGDGILNQSTGWVEISGGSIIAYNRDGVRGDGSVIGAYTDFLSSTSYGQTSGTGYYTTKPSSYIWDDALNSNRTGLHGSGDGLSVQRNTFNDNISYGLLLTTGTYDVVASNSGLNNGLYDCYESGLVGLTHYSNSWTKTYGSTCLP